MKGRIKVDSQEGKGTSFIVTIPLTAEATQLSSFSNFCSSQNDIIPCCQNPILIFESDHKKIQLFSLALNNLGCDVKSFSSITKALDFITTSKLTAIFIELNQDNIPKIYDFLTKINKNEKSYPFPSHIPVIVLLSRLSFVLVNF